MSVYDEITQKIVKLLKGGTPPWRKPWESKSPFSIHSMPVNAETRREYRGINVPLLWWAQQEEGFTTPLWATEKTWKRLGGVPLKHHKPTPVYLFRRSKKVDILRKKDKQAVFLTTFNVYNLDQIHGCLRLKASVKPKAVSKESDIDFDPADQLVTACGARIIHRGNEAKYNMHSDIVYLPPKTSFKNRIGYYSTKLHEVVHWTGHESRLKRKFGPTRKSPEYAYEELVAEIGACFLCSRLGIPEALDEMPQHATYVKEWLSILQEDERAVFRAASAATRAVDFLFNYLNPEPEAEEDEDEE